MRYPIMNLHRIGGMLEDYQKENDAFKEKLSRLNQDAARKWAQEHPGPVHHPPMFPGYPPFSEPPPEPSPYGSAVDFGAPRAPLPPTLPGISVATGVPSREPPLTAPPPPSYPPPPPVNPPAPSVDRWFPPRPSSTGIKPAIPTTQTPATTGLAPTTPLPGTPPPVASTACPPGQFWDDRQCRGSIGPMPGGIPGGESQGAETGVLNTASAGNFASLAGRGFLGRIRLLPAHGFSGASRLTDLVSGGSPLHARSRFDAHETVPVLGAMGSVVRSAPPVGHADPGMVHQAAGLGYVPQIAPAAPLTTQPLDPTVPFMPILGVLAAAGAAAYMAFR